MLLRIVSIVVAVLIIGILFLAATGPNTFEVSRSVGINAPADRIFPLINDFQGFVTWYMRGSRTFVAKLLNVFIDTNQMVGGDFEAGLASLKVIAEQ